MSDILINIEPIIPELKIKIQNKIQEIKLLSNEQYYNREFETEWIAPYNYMGFAPKGTSEDVSLWRIYRIWILEDGTIGDIDVVYNVKWTDRLIINFD